MNKQLEDFARKTLKAGLELCTEDEKRLFKLMYWPSLNDLVDINIVVDKMDAEKLDWAMQQVQMTLDKKND